MIHCETMTAGSGKDCIFLTVDFASMTNIRGDVIMMRKNPSGYELFRENQFQSAETQQEMKLFFRQNPNPELR
ncbi:MAG: hypothetical protein IPG99_02920 [Ignavibacteria bacterium]|nr:hypothetical protein [Ignavibacteria bacterium]